MTAPYVPPSAPVTKNSIAYVHLAGGLNVTVDPFIIGDFVFAGATVAAPSTFADGLNQSPAGTWYIGVDLFTLQAIFLPRNIHTGWIPLACLTLTDTSVSINYQISPAIPPSRLPRVLKKIRSGQTINSATLGPSAVQWGFQGNVNAQGWADMMTNSSIGNCSLYCLPNYGNYANLALSGSGPGMASGHLGIASNHTNPGTVAAAGYPGLLNITKKNPNGRSRDIQNADVVFISGIGNQYAGDHHLELIEANVRRLRKLGKDVVLLTEVPQIGSTSVYDYTTQINTTRYVDGPEMRRIADLYGCEVADTAGYIMSNDYRIGTAANRVTGYHPSYGVPNGRASVAASCGSEAFVRAVRSVFTIDATQAVSPNVLPNNSDGTFASLTGISADGYQNGNSSLSGTYMSATVSAGALSLNYTANALQFAGVGLTVPALVVGHSYTYTVVVSSMTSGIQLRTKLQNVTIGGGGTAAGLATTAGTTTVNFTPSGSDGLNLTGTILGLVRYDGSAIAGSIVISKATLIDNTAGISYTLIDYAPNRPNETKPIPPSPVRTDYTTPGDAFVILARDEYLVNAAAANAGVLQVSPYATTNDAYGTAQSSTPPFTRAFNNDGSAKDMLTLAPGKSAVFSAQAVVGWDLVLTLLSADVASSMNVYRNGNATPVYSGAVGGSGAWEAHSVIIPITTFAQTLPNPGTDTITVTNTHATASFHIAAAIAHTADVEFIPVEEIKFVGSWLAKQNSPTGSGSIPGIPTQTAGDYAYVNCTGQRVMWLITGDANSQPYDLISPQNQSLANAALTSGTANWVGGLVGPNGRHMIRNTASVSGNGTSGYALHIAGAMIINDR